MYRGEVRNRTLGVLCTLGLVLSAGCATPRPAPAVAVATDSREEFQAPSHFDKPTSQDPHWRLKMRSYLLRLHSSEMPPNARRVFQRKLELARGTVEVLGFEEGADAEREDGGASVLLVQPPSVDTYQMNAWTTWLPRRVKLSLADAWVAPDRTMAILLVKMDRPPGAVEPETRWVVLGTDGQQLWAALGQPPEEQLLVPSASLFSSGKRLYLDVKQRYVTRMNLGKDGRFIQNPATE